MIPYSIYDYLSFIIPGGMILFTAVYGWFGWPWHEPGGTALVGIVAAAFVIGNAVAALASWVEPIFLGSIPGTRPDGLWGQFAKGDRYEDRRSEVEAVFRRRYDDNLDHSYRLAQVDLRNLGKSGDLDRINSQIGFYRGMAVASGVSLLIEVTYVTAWHSHLPSALWMAIFAVLSLLSIYRYRRFWRYFGDYVIRTVTTLERESGRGSEAGS